MSSKVQIEPLSKVITILNKTDGRDKLGKLIQNLTRFLAFHYLNKDKELSQRLNGLSGGMRDARKLFRLFKSMNEVEKVLELSQQPTQDQINKILNILIRSFFGGYWFFDNLVILISVKFLKSNKEKASKAANSFWFVALLLSQIQALRVIYGNFQKLVNLKLQLTASNDKQAVLKQIETVKKNNITQFMKIISCGGDMLGAGTGCNFWKNVFGRTPNSGLIGLGGMTSAAIGGYQMF